MELMSGAHLLAGGRGRGGSDELGRALGHGHYGVAGLARVGGRGEKGRREWAVVGRKERGGGNEPKWLFHFLFLFSIS
jgi:hypothetical protein